MFGWGCSIAFATPPVQAEEADPVSDRSEAEERYNRALELFNEGSYDASRLEFQRAYELAPSYRILYNVALVNVQMNDYAAALTAFELFLSEGADNIPATRQDEVRSTIEQLQTKVGFLEVTVDESDTEVFVDDILIGTTPLLNEVRVNVGRRRIDVSWKGERKTQVVEVAGGDHLDVEFQMVKPMPAVVEVPFEDDNPAPPPKRAPVYISWGVTGALAAGSATFGILALGAKSQQTKEKEKLGVSSAELEASASKVKSLALVTDILLGATVISAGVAVYLTLKTPRTSSDEKVSLVIHPKGASLIGTF